MTTDQPETWLGNIQRAVDDYCESGCCKRCADMANRQAAQTSYCTRCGIPHTGECLRGKR